MHKFKYKFYISAVVVLAILISQIAGVVQPTKASALTGSQFNAGRIIEDAAFYNPNTMSTSSVQNFLNAKVSTCDTNGTTLKSYHYRSSDGRINNSADPTVTTSRATYGQRYATWYNSHPYSGYIQNESVAPYICLRDYKQNTPAKNAESGLCGYLTAKTGRTSAQIINDVAAACSINPQVLIVLLQKEQGLVTDDWPWDNQFDKATGFACPDTSGCNTAYYGFFNQVYSAARQFKRYKVDPTNWNYVAGQSNKIFWQTSGGNFLNPTGNASDPSRSGQSGCGYSMVSIQNQATAGLYNYTPYRPNQAALNNLYGTGDSCSAYGNRNFWRYFNDWFGSTTYSWAASIVSTQIYTDQNRTQPLSGTTIAPGQTLYYTVTAKNTGYGEWQNSFVKIGTANPYNRSSQFYDSSWPEKNRPSYLEEPTVAPGSNGTFNFSLTAPLNNGTYSEQFNLVAEGKAWMPGGDLTFSLNVSSPYNAVLTELSSYSDSALTHPTDPTVMASGEQLYFRLKMRNTGTQTWQNTITKLATVDPNNRASDFYDSSWPATNRLAFLKETSVAPGQVGTFEYTLKGPATTNLYDEHFGLVAEGVSWMPGAKYSQTIKVVEPPLDTLYPGVRMYPGEALNSKDGRYKLVLQGDGNLVLYASGKGALWSTRTNRSKASCLVMQGDGNLVLYRYGGGVLWSSKTNGHGTSRLKLQSDGNLVIYDAAGHATWATYTVQKG